MEKNARQIDLCVGNMKFLPFIPQSEHLSGTHGSYPLPGLQIHVGAPSSGLELCFGLSLHQARVEAFTVGNPYIIGENT